MSGPSDQAVKTATATSGHSGPVYESIARVVLEAAHDPALGLDRSVCLRDVVEALGSGDWAEYYEGGLHDAADFIEREFGGGS